MAFDKQKPPINSLLDLKTYLYFQIGTLTMNEIDTMIEIIRVYKMLLKDE